MDLPTFSSYGEYSSSNYGAHALQFTVGGLTVYFSYKTPVAFRGRTGLVVRKNNWGPTTGKHLNWIDGGDKKSRVPGEIFQRMLAEEVASREVDVPAVT